MELPIKFPSETEVILKDVARFRVLSPAERARAIQSFLADGDYLMKLSPKAEWARQYADEEKRIVQQTIRKFIARHA